METASAWPMVPLGNVIQQRREFIEINDFETYKRCRVQLHAKGIVLRDLVEGYKLKTKKQQVCRPREFLVAEIDAKVGGFGIVSEELDGAIVSSHYFLFVVDETALDRRFLDYFIRTPDFQKQVSAQGSTNYASIRPQHVLGYEIPLPSLEEQRRIVARIEKLAAKVEAAQALREEAVGETERLIRAASAAVFEGVVGLSQPVGDVIGFRNDLIRPDDGKSGVIRFVGLQHIEPHTGRRLGEDYLRAEELTGRKFRFSPGEIVYGYLRPYLNKVWIADCEGVCSVDQYVIQPDPNLVDTKYQAHFMRSDIFLKQANELTHNLMLPRLRTALLASIPIPLPPLAKQRRIVAYLDALQAKVEAVKQRQAATTAALDALLPSILDRAFKGKL
jgi:type I restriction enzyme S subunit